MSLIDSLEIKGFFRFTRFFAVLFIMVLTVGLIIGGALFSKIWPTQVSTRVNPSQVLEIEAERGPATRPAPQNTEDAEALKVLADLRIPEFFPKYFGDNQNRGVLVAHLGKLPEKARQDYLDNMAEVVALAENQGADVVQALNIYMQKKDQNIADIEAAKAAAITTRAYIVASFLSGLGLIVLFTLILVLLAIERNTRRPAQ